MKRTEFLQSLFNGSKKLFAAIFDWKPQFSKSLHLASMPDFQRVNMEICCFREQQPSNNPSKVADASAIWIFQLYTLFERSTPFRDFCEEILDGANCLPGLVPFLLIPTIRNCSFLHLKPWHGHRYSHSRCPFSCLLIPICALGKLVAATPKNWWLHRHFS